ncbi:MAG: DUF5694 domain-containing protein [Parvularculaceae bacterium]
MIGSMHLSGANDDFDKKSLSLLLNKLEAFAPDVITFENLPGESVFLLKAYEAVYDGVADQYGGRILAIAELARDSTNLDMPAAEAESRKLLAALPEKPSPAERRRLAAAFAASGDPYSAVVQLRQLSPSERKAKDGLTKELIETLLTFGERRNESLLIGVELAVRLGLQKVYAMDDHAADDLAILFSDDIGAAIESDPDFEAIVNSPVIVKANDSVNHLRSPEETLETYRDGNAPETVIDNPTAQWLYFLTRDWPDNLGRKRLAEWEARNLRMAGNIREAMVNATGGKVLVIVGGAHKPYLDAYLDLMHDVEIIDALEVLK